MGLQHALPKQSVSNTGECGIGFDPCFGISSSHSKQLDIARELCYSKWSHPRLFCTEQFTRTANLQILLRNLEPVVRTYNRFKSGFGVVRDGIGQQHAKARPTAPADPPAKLMELR